MKKPIVLLQGLVAGKRLFLVAFILSSLAAFAYINGNNSWLPLREARALPFIYESGGIARKPSPLDLAMGALSPNDAARYRAIFMAQRRGEWGQADALISRLNDKRLLGHVFAERYQRGQGSEAEIKEWLRKYPELPQAERIYKLIEYRKETKQKNLRLKNSQKWSAGQSNIEAEKFETKIEPESLPGTETHKIETAISSAIEQKEIAYAHKMLVNAKTNLSEKFVTKANAAIAASYFYMGERKEAGNLAKKAAEAQNPLGLWIYGLIAWEQKECLSAARNFAKLTSHPDLETADRTAASFWAYRSFVCAKREREARHYLEEAALYPHNFYGFIAASLTERLPSISRTYEEEHGWNLKKRQILSRYSAGWRALALIQAGEPELAENELRHLDPRGNEELQAAMRSLALYVPMPALSLQLAGLTRHKDPFKNILNAPIPAWSPQNGFQIDKALLFALAKHESGFDPVAVSVRGAQGLMQIMPATAVVMSGPAQRSIKSELFDPVFSLEIGQKYVLHLTEQPQIGNNLLLLLAAYNAGPAKAMRWKDEFEVRFEKGTADPFLFIENIPQRETRHHLKQVLLHYWNYRTRLGLSLITLKQLIEGKWPELPMFEERPAKQEEAKVHRYFDSPTQRYKVASEIFPTAFKLLR